MDTRHLTTSQQPGEQHSQVHYTTLVSDTNTVMATVPSTHPDAMLCMAEGWTWWWRRRDHLARPSALLNNTPIGVAPLVHIQPTLGGAPGEMRKDEGSNTWLGTLVMGVRSMWIVKGSTQPQDTA